MNTSRVAIISAVILVALIAILYFTGALSAGLKALKLVPIKESYTELYFADPASLPKTVKTGDVLNFAFTIHNMEGDITQYPYRVYISAHGVDTVIDASSTQLWDGDSAVLHETYHVKKQLSPAKVTVELIGRSEHIDFLLQ